MSNSIKVFTYVGYLDAVFAGRSVEEVVAEFGLNTSDRRQLDEWLGHAEEAVCGASLPEEWSEYHARALDALQSGGIREGRITVDRGKMGGAPCIRDLRIPVSVILSELDAGISDSEILRLHPDLNSADIEAVREWRMHGKVDGGKVDGGE